MSSLLLAAVPSLWDMNCTLVPLVPLVLSIRTGLVQRVANVFLDPIAINNGFSKSVYGPSTGRLQEPLVVL